MKESRLSASISWRGGIPLKIFMNYFLSNQLEEITINVLEQEFFQNEPLLHSMRIVTLQHIFQRQHTL